jgi:hypothetical protein
MFKTAGKFNKSEQYVLRFKKFTIYDLDPDPNNNPDLDPKLSDPDGQDDTAFL